VNNRPVLSLYWCGLIVLCALCAGAVSAPMLMLFLCRTVAIHSIQSPPWMYRATSAASSSSATKART
jgi:hypothetical protein